MSGRRASHEQDDASDSLAQQSAARHRVLLQSLTPKGERRALRLVAAGHTDRQIAEELVISVATAKTHVRHLLRKLKIQSRYQAAAIAKDHSSNDGNPKDEK